MAFVDKGFRPFEKKVWLSSPTMHGEELEYITQAYDTNWMSTVGENINQVEKLISEKIGVGYAVGLSAGTAALHMAVNSVQQSILLFMKEVFLYSLILNTTPGIWILSL